MACQCDMTCECAQDEVRGGLEAWGQVAGLLSSGIGALLRVAVFLEFPCFFVYASRVYACRAAEALKHLLPTCVP